VELAGQREKVIEIGLVYLAVVMEPSWRQLLILGRFILVVIAELAGQQQKALEIGVISLVVVMELN
jgi:hypothetical protein